MIEELSYYMQQTRKDEYIKLISKASNKYGDHLLKLMEECGVKNLKDVTLEQAKNFYERLSDENK